MKKTRTDYLCREETAKNHLRMVFNETDRKNIYARMDCLIVPSVWNETGPMVLYEAFANRIPAVVSDQESLKEKVKDRVDGYIFKTGDEADLLKGILWVKKNYGKLTAGTQGFEYERMSDFDRKLTDFLHGL